MSRVTLGCAFLFCIGVVALQASCRSISSGSDPLALQTTQLTEVYGRVYATSYVGKAVLGDLMTELNAKEFEKTWNISDDNSLPANFVLQTPPANYIGMREAELTQPQTCKPSASDAECDPDFALRLCTNVGHPCDAGGDCVEVLSSVKRPGDAPRAMCVGHSDSLYEEMYKIITSGRKQVDVTSLSPPSSRFLPALRNALTYLSALPNPPTVRLLFGDFPVAGNVNVKSVLADLTRDISNESPITVSVGAYRVDVLVNSSWNHSKIVAADGLVAMTGGHNMFPVYLGIDPVHDISMIVHGTAARHAQDFASELWSYTCSMAGSWRTGVATSFSGQRASPQGKCVDPRRLGDNARQGNAVVISSGGVGKIKDSGNPNTVAAVTAIASARSTIKMSLQDLGPPNPLAKTWPAEAKLLPALAKALERNVHVYIVLSDFMARGGGLGFSEAQYENGWKITTTAQKIADAFANEVKDSLAYRSKEAQARHLCNFLHVAPLRIHPEESNWAPKDANGQKAVRYGNHAKAFAIDDQAFYVGSQNFYGSNLAEHSYLVDDAAATRQIIAQYFDPLWALAKTAAVTGGEPECMFSDGR